jgi:hypothetical protein
MKSTMYNSPHDPTVGILDAILCWLFYVIGTSMHAIESFPKITFYLQNTSFVLGIIVGLVTLLRHLGFNMNLRKKLNKDK